MSSGEAEVRGDRTNSVSGRPGVPLKSSARLEGGYVFATPWMPTATGGVATVVANLARRARDGGLVQPFLLVCDWARVKAVQGAFEGVPTTEMRFRGASGSSGAFGTLRYLLSAPISLWRMQRYLRERDVRTVNVHYPGSWITTLVLLRSLGLYRGRIILSFHGLDLESAAQARGLDRAVWNWFARRADAIVACSRALAGRCREVFPSEAERITHVWNGVDPSSMEDSPSGGMPSEIAGNRYILNVATYEPKKGQDILIRAFRRLRGDWPDLHLVLAGRPKSTLSALREQAAELGIADHVHFFPDVPNREIGTYYKGAAVVAHPSRQEPFGIAPLEAGAFGRPVVASKVGGLVEFLRHGENALLVVPDSPEVLAEALRAVLSDDELATRLGNALQKDALEKFSWERCWARYQAIAHGEIRPD